ncbi:aminotransferase class I/II-fold pyridoxal phosphate-dependent enzyme [Candidatus Dojkabacteria bacterium]|nr:aminotransferase class I/II-fold pyridoxal phosphate-dependent enzyme [Candidatus Dojkabacteria bacterium]
MNKPNLKKTDPELHNLIEAEQQRQQDKLSMIPSENFASKAVREAVGSVMMNKYSEGNIGKRYYEGNQYIDQIEQLAIDRAKRAFSLPDDWDVNVQALSGSNANLAVYLTVLDIGDTMMGMYLPDGGHLSHGWSYEPGVQMHPDNLLYMGGERKVHITSKIYDTIQYKTSPDNQLFDWDEIEKIATEKKPKLIITGGTAYPRDFDYKRVKEIASKVGAYYLADIAHEAGLISAGVLNSPVGIADFVTLTTHKTLRCTRGAMIMANEELIKKVNRAILPGLQGGPHNHNIAGIVAGLEEALKPEFKEYAKQVIANSKLLADELKKYDFRLVTDGTDKHLILIDLTNKGIYGKKSARALDHAGIVTNMNTMPQETRSPADPSALRLGTPIITGRGMKEAEMKQIAEWINAVIEIAKEYAELDFDEFENAIRNDDRIEAIANGVKQLCKKYPLDI